MSFELIDPGFPYFGFPALDEAGIAAGFMTRTSEPYWTDAGRERFWRPWRKEWLSSTRSTVTACM